MRYVPWHVYFPVSQCKSLSNIIPHYSYNRTTSKKGSVTCYWKETCANTSFRTICFRSETEQSKRIHPIPSRTWQKRREPTERDLFYSIILQAVSRLSPRVTGQGSSLPIVRGEKKSFRKSKSVSSRIVCYSLSFVTFESTWLAREITKACCTLRLFLLHRALPRCAVGMRCGLALGVEPGPQGICCFEQLGVADSAH